ncbi:uncharacterized protein [Lolium perenne]|uniref:uncharacterized protein isoform X5 n=1 Tax=Lolium perenne TaxID=4522 RepID=UPI003A990011
MAKRANQVRIGPQSPTLPSCSRPAAAPPPPIHRRRTIPASGSTAGEPNAGSPPSPTEPQTGPHLGRAGPARAARLSSLRRQRLRCRPSSHPPRRTAASQAAPHRQGAPAPPPRRGKSQPHRRRHRRRRPGEEGRGGLGKRELGFARPVTIFPDKTMDPALDHKEQFNVDLDPQKTLDFALFKRVRSQLMNPAESEESMAMLINCLLNAREPDEDKKLPPLDVIIYKDLVPLAWSWDRLLPWMSGTVLFEDYFNYLEEYFRQNFANDPPSLNLQAAAAACIVAEDELTTTMDRHAELFSGGPDVHALSTKIVEQAHQITHLVPVQSSVPAACFLCIVEEAKLMSRLADCISMADESMAGLWQWKFQFSEDVRKAALDILTTYKGPYSRQVSASLLGMQKEAITARELLNIADVNLEEKMHISELIRTSLLKLFDIILDYFPPESSVKYYPINRDYPALTSELTGSLHLLEPSKQIRSVDGSSPANNYNIVKIPVTPNIDAPATPLSCSASFLSDEDSVKDTKTNRKRKNIVGTQVSGTPRRQSSEPRKDVVIEDLLCSQITSDGDSSSASFASTEEYGKDINTSKKRIMGGPKESEVTCTQSSEPWKDVGMLDQLGSQITNDCVAAPFNPTTDTFSGSFPSISITHSVDLFGDGSDEDLTKKSKRTCDIQVASGSGVSSSENADYEK